jgi:hypothetical protein
MSQYTQIVKTRTCPRSFHFFFRWLMAGLTNRVPVRDFRSGTPLLPSLFGLANILANLLEPSKIADLEEFSTVLTSIQEHIHGVASTKNTVQYLDPCVITTTSSSSGKRPTSSRPLLPPSPERRQKRKGFSCAVLVTPRGIYIQPDSVRYLLSI